MVNVDVLPLVPNIPLPRPAPARTREHVPEGYGTQEQCLPFVVAAGLGFLIPSPIAFGLCAENELPAAARPFRSPLEPARPDGIYDDDRLFYVVDDPERAFVGNAFAVGVESAAWYEPGISFFDRPDQVDLFKVHLPYIWRTSADLALFILPPINRESSVTAYSGVVETRWYANPVNLVFRKPAGALHVAVGDPIAQALLLPLSVRRPKLNVVGPETGRGAEMLRELGQWQAQKAADRSVYKRLSRDPERAA